MNISARELLGPSGPFARALPTHEVRAGQLEMAEAVERALAEERVLFCEAGTGTGKTLAYLVPALLSGKKVVVSTATRALEDQILGHDLPVISSVLGIEPRVRLMKGIGNYVCLRRYHEFRAGPMSQGAALARSHEAVARWLEETETGDHAELARLAEDDPIWREVLSSSDTRLGSGCTYFEECWITRMRREADAADLVIVNHHLFFADLALRGPHPARVIPDYDAVIFDEAHQLEDIASSFFGIRITRTRLEHLTRDAARALMVTGKNDAARGPGGSALLDEFERAVSEFWSRLRSTLATDEGRATVEHDVWAGPMVDAWHRLDSALEAVGSLARQLAGAALLITPGLVSSRGMSRSQVYDAFESVARRSDDLRDQLASVVEGTRGNVTWFDDSGHSPALSSTPVDVSEIFRGSIFERIPSVILTSATLSSSAPPLAPSCDVRGESRVSGPVAFRYLRSRLGVADDRVQISELALASPFDFNSRALLYTPRDLPEPSAPAFLHEAVNRVTALCEISCGGAFILTTSLRSMHAIHRRLSTSALGNRLLVQGQAPKQALLSTFRAAGDAVLIATLSFWEGVDIPGDALRLVVLEKIPFPVPSDPVVRARSLALEANGQNAFMELHVPSAAITLKQGFGRLIRTERDWGAVALLDVRVHRRGYGRRLLAALPPAAQTADLDVVRQFWKSASAGLFGKVA